MADRSIYTFWRLLQDRRVEIPLIQRDYAQGRIGKESLRKQFLSAINEALSQDGKRLQLDFVYGTDDQGVMTPLDGQQRLTTLWLLHWYLAYKSNNLNPKVQEVLRRFSYKTRDSSCDFCYELARFTSPIPEEKSLAEHIENQNWFCAYWKQDPTVQSMIRMLCGSVDKDGKALEDGIAQIFKDAECEQMWQSLLNDGCSIVFHFLDLAGIRQSDDLYIKMNARGEQLTDFENFKADLTEYLSDKAESESECSDDGYSALLNDKEGLPIKIDRDWMNIFWNGSYCDEAFMAFINRFLLNCIVVEKGENGYKNVGSNFEEGSNEQFDYFYGRSPKGYFGEKCIDDSRIAYSDFSVMKCLGGELPYKVLISLRDVLNGYQIFIEKLGLNDVNSLTSSSWVEEFHFIPEYTGEKVRDFKNDEIWPIKKITQNERVLFFAVCRFLEKIKDNQNSTLIKLAFKRWMRVVWNLISDDRMRTVTDMVNQLQLVDQLSEGAMRIYNYLLCYNSALEKTILSDRLEEEKTKAKKILEDPMWETKIIEYEGKKLSRGSIRYLYHDAEDKVDWNSFEQKARNFAWDDALAIEKNLLKGLVSHCAKWDELKKIEYDFRQSTWMRNLSNKKLATAVHYFLMNEDRSFSDSKQSHINCYNDLTETDILSNLYYGESAVYGCRLRDDKYGLIALLPSNAKSEQKKYVLGNPRNRALSKLIGLAGYSCEQRIKGLNLFWGWDLCFKDSKNNIFKLYMSLKGGNWEVKLDKIDSNGAIISSPSPSPQLDKLRKIFGIK